MIMMKDTEMRTILAKAHDAGIHDGSVAAVVPMLSPRSGKPVANQCIMRDVNGETFQSYGTNIAKRYWHTGTVILDKSAWNYSSTTGKYRNIFLKENKRETRRKIDSGEYELVDLN